MSTSQKRKDFSLFLKAALSFFLVEALVFASIDFQTVAAYADEAVSASATTATEISATLDVSSVAITSDSTATDLTSGYETLLSGDGEQVVSLSNAVIGEGDEVDGISRKIGSVYHYKDSYFFKTAREYNPSLSTMSLCLALAGFGTADDYAHDYKYAEEMFNEIGFVDIMPNYGMKHKPTEDSIGVTAARKVIKDEDGTQATLLAFTIRGGNYEAEWAGNTKLGATGEAEGFGRARDQVVEHINDYIDTYRDQFVGKVKIWVVGFSRASATTNLTGNFLDCAVQNTGSNTDLMVRTRNNLSSIGLTSNDDIYAYGFEVPKGGHASTIYKAADNSNLWCIVDSNDLVPYVAPGTSGFDFYRYGNTVSLTTKSNGGEISYDEMIAELARFEPQAAENFKNRRVYKTRDDFEMMTFDPTCVPVSMYVYGTDLDGSLGPVGTKEASSMSDFLNKLIDYVAKAGGSRENYANNLQPVVSELTRVIMGGTGDEKDALLSTLQDGFLYSLDYADSIACYMEIVHPVRTHMYSFGTETWYKLIKTVGTGKGSTGRLIQNVGKALKGGFSSLMTSEKTRDLFTDDTYRSFFGKADYLAEFAVKFAIVDLADHDGQFIGTTIHYMEDLTYAHEPDYVAAYLRLKDPNYSAEIVGDHQLTYSFDNEDSQNAHVMEVLAVYKKDNSATISLGTIRNNAISGIPEEYEGKLSYSYVDGKNYLKVSRKLKEDYDIRFVFTSTSSATGNLQLKYRNCSPDGNVVTAGDQFFENAPIAFSKGDTITLTCDDNEGEATFTKTIGVTFDYGVYSAEEGSHGYRILGQNELDNLFVTLNKSDTKRSTAGFKNLDYKGSYNFTVVGDSGNYSLRTAYEGSYDANGNFVVGENGKYALKRVSNTAGSVGPRSLEWTMNNDFSATTKHYLITLFDANAQNYGVTLGAVSIQGESRTVLSGANYTVTNETKDVSTEGPVEASVGDRITVSLSGAPDGYIFTRWAMADGTEPTFAFGSGTLENTSFTFSMPEEPVSLVAECVPKSESVDVVVVGRWATEYASASGFYYGDEDLHLNPDGNGWSQTYVKPSSLGGEARFDSQGTHVFKRTGTEKADHLYIEAPASYVSGDGQVYSFDHWRVTTLDGQEYNEKIAEVMIPYYSDSGEFEWAIIKSNNIETTEPFAANGSVESYLVIQNSRITQSLRFEPVYGLTAKYTYNVTLTNGNTVTGRVPAGEKVKIADVADSEHSFISWDASKISVETVQSERLGVSVPKISKSNLAVDNKYSTSLAFTMPQNDVTITAKRDTKTYSIKLSGEVSSNVRTAAAGDTVVLTSSSRDLAIGGWENPDNIEIRGCRNTSGVVDRYNFTMPNHDVTLTAIMRPLGRHTLSFEGTSARIWDGPNSTGGYLHDVQEGQEVDVFPDYREGYVVKSWHIDTADGSEVYSSVNDWGKLTLIMPNCNVYAVPIYTPDPYYVPRNTYSLSASSMESGENSLGSSEGNGLFGADTTKTCRVSRVDDVLYVTVVSAGITPEELFILLPKTTMVEIEGDRVPANISWSLSSTIDSSRDFIVTGTVEPVLDGTPYEGRTVEYAKGIDNGVTAFVSISGQGTLPAPSLSEDLDDEGYNYAPTAVFDTNSGTDLYCYVAPASVDPGTITAETVVAMGVKVENNKYKLPSESGDFVLYAVYKASSDTMREGKTIAAGTSGEVSSFKYTIKLPEDGKYAVMATNASGSGNYVPGVEVTVVADEPEQNASLKGSPSIWVAGIWNISVLLLWVILPQPS